MQGELQFFPKVSGGQAMEGQQEHQDYQQQNSAVLQALKAPVLNNSLEQSI